MSTKTNTRRAPARKTPAPRRYPEVVKTPAAPAREMREVHLHPNVCQLVDCGDVHLCVTEQIPGSLERFAVSYAKAGAAKLRRFDSTGKEIPSDA